MIAPFFHRWERRLASVDTNRVVRPFDWGLEWIGEDPAAADPGERVAAWSRAALADTDAFFASTPTDEYRRIGDRLQYPSAAETPFPENNTVTMRVFPARETSRLRPKRAVIVLPQWNSDPQGHVGLCRLFARYGLTALRMCLPYHEDRRPPELERADYIVSANIARTIQANRQAVLDVRRAVDWLAREGFERIGIIGTSLGSCLSMLAMAHDERIRAGAFNHVSPFFADVTWRGLSTRHVRAGLEGHVTLEQLRELWMPISPWPFVERVRNRRVQLIYARYDLTFPVDLSRHFVHEFERRRIAYDVAVLPCGHYTTGKAPFKFFDGYLLVRFFVKNL